MWGTWGTQRDAFDRCIMSLVLSFSPAFCFLVAMRWATVLCYFIVPFCLYLGGAGHGLKSLEW